MPPQYEQTWAGSGQLAVSDPLVDSLFDNIFDDINFDCVDATNSLFDGLLPEFEHTDMMDDVLSSFQVRHDCMWAGTCVEDKERPSPLDRLQESPAKCRPGSGAACASAPACGATPTKDTEVLVPSPHQTSVLLSSRTPSSVKLNQRSILRTNLNLANSACVASSDPLRTASQDESDDSGRPETPQSLSSDTEGADFKHDTDLASSFVDEDDDDDDDDDEEEEDEEEESEEEEDDDAPSAAVPVSDVTGQTVRTSVHQQHESRVSRFDSRPQHTAVSNHFFNDHSYHLSKDVSATIPGNLTPSDSEDEIDVVSVCGEKSSSSRSSSQGALPTNPSARDRHALQQTMASAMKRSAYSSYMPSGRQPSGKLARMQAERQRQRERKRRAQERDDSSEEDVVRPSKKRAKHHHAYKPVRRGHGHGGGHGSGHSSSHGHHSFKSASSDSEPDSCEKRSLHNNMERQRRVDLRNAFEDLRVVVPPLSSNPRAAKVVILKEASHYCHQLAADAKSLQQESGCLERERDRLLARVSFLRKQVASMRMSM